MALHVRIMCPPIPEAIEALAEGLVRLNVALMRFADEKGVELPPLYESGIKYRREPTGREWWESADDVVGLAAKKSGDCEDLAAYRAAELRYYEGEVARVAILRTSRGSFHAVVEREDGTLEDPSKILVEEERDMRAARDMFKKGNRR
jgi:hypothetical protein